MRKIAVALLLGTLVFSPGIALAEDDNAALAEQYRAKADSARAEARVHESMAKSYRLGPVKLTQQAEMQRHCQKISDSQKAIAAEFDALAKAHEAESKK